MNPRNGALALKRSQLQKAQQPPALRAVPLYEEYRERKEWMICGKNGAPNKEQVQAEMESILLKRGQENPGLGVAIVRADKESLNNINKSGGKHEAGDAVIEASMSVLAATMQIAYRATNENPYLFRDNQFSDETLQISTGDMSLLEQINPEKFLASYQAARALEMANLSNRRYMGHRLIPGQAKAKEIPMTLAQYARSLQDPTLVTACHLSAPKIIHLANERPGFIKRAIEQIEKEELAIVSNLPSSFRPSIQGIPADSPFKHSNKVSGELPKNTVAIEIKFKHTNQTTRFMPLRVMDKAKKGISEIFRNGCGLRYINTFYGKQIADHILSAVAQAMKEIDSSISPVGKTDSNLIYIVENSTIEEIEKKIQLALSKKIKELGLEQLELEPSLTTINASALHVNDLRSALALKSLGKEIYPAETLTYTDLLISAVKIMNSNVVNEANAMLHEEARKLGSYILGVIQSQIDREVGIRDTEDLVWIMRVNEEKHHSGIEESLFTYALEMGKQFRNNLLDIISKL